MMGNAGISCDCTANVTNLPDVLWLFLMVYFAALCVLFIVEVSRRVRRWNHNRGISRVKETTLIEH